MILGPWILSRYGWLTIGVGDGEEKGPKLDLVTFLAFVPLVGVFTLYAAFGEALVPPTARYSASEGVFATLLALGCLLLQREYRPSLRQLGLHRQAFRSNAVGAWVLCAIAFSLFRHAIPVITGTLFPTAVDPRELQEPAFLLFTGIIFPIEEELIFRGYLYLVVRQNWGRTTAALVSSGAFSLVHANLDPEFFALSLLDVWLNNKARSLLPSVARHATWNAAFLIFPGLPAK